MVFPGIRNKVLALDDIHIDMVVILGNAAPTVSTVKNGVAELKRRSLEDDARSGTLNAFTS